MPKKTYSEIVKELNSKKKSEENLKKRVSTLKEESLRYKAIAKSLPIQYERVVKEWKKMYEDVVSNGWKLLIIKVVEKWNKIRGK